MSRSRREVGANFDSTSAKVLSINVYFAFDGKICRCEAKVDESRGLVVTEIAKSEENSKLRLEQVAQVNYKMKKIQ
jgi:hypothetical protein